MSYLLGIDIGTSSAKAVVCDERGRVAGEGSAAYPLFSPRPGWNEQDPADWWKGTVKAVRGAMRSARARGDSIVGVGLSGQMHGAVFLDARDRPLGRAILWNDQRTGKQCAEITARAGGLDGLVALVNNAALPGFTAPKIVWLREANPPRFARVRKVLLPKDFIRLVMTGEHATDVADASGTLLLDVATRRWNRTLLDLLKIDEAILPPLLESSQVAGKLRPAAAAMLGIRPGTPVVAGAGDQPAGAVGMGVVWPGTVSATIGTSGVVFAHSDTVVPNPGGVLQSFCHAVSGKWCVFGCMLSAGASLEWARGVLYPARKPSFDAMMAEAAGAPPGARGLFFLPYLDGERCPHPDPNARACWIGLSRLHGRADMIRAVVEGVTFGMADQMLLMRELGVRPGEVRLGGGGAKSAFWRQLQADIYGVPTVRVETENASALGAALLAGVGAGVWKAIEDACAAAVRPKEKRRPRPKLAAFYAERHHEYRRLYPALRERLEGLAAVGR